MCMTPSVKTPDPEPPVAPIATPKPMALPDAKSKRENGLSQLRIASRSVSSADGSTGGLTINGS